MLVFNIGYRKCQFVEHIIYGLGRSYRHIPYKFAFVASVEDQNDKLQFLK